MATINPSNQQITNHSVQVGAANNLLTSLAVATTGSVFQGVTGADPTSTTSPTIGTTSTSALLTIASNAQTCFAIDNTVAHGTTPLIDLYHDASTVANDFAYEIDFNAKNSTPAKKTFASVQAQVSVNTATSEMGTYLVNTINAGSSQNNIKVGNNLGQYRGTQTNTAPPAGFLGEYITSTVGSVSLTTATPANLTSISITAGVWDVVANGNMRSSTTGITYAQIGISTNTGSFTGTVSGDSTVNISSSALLANNVALNISGFRVTLSGTTTYYLVGQITGSGTLAADARLSATRVG